MRHHVPVSDQHDGPVRIARQHRHRRQQVIHPTAQEPDPHDQRRRDRPDRLVEIRAVLFGDPVHLLWRQRRARGFRHRIKVADQQVRQPPDRAQPVAAAVCRNHGAGLVQ